MTLVDAGPIIALIDTSDSHHNVCMEVSNRLRISQMATIWACFVEAKYQLGTTGGYRYQDRLWHIRRDGKLDILETTPAETDRMAVLMKQYQHVPMDLADASLIAVAESRGIHRLFTKESDFYIYRLADASMVEVVR